MAHLPSWTFIANTGVRNLLLTVLGAALLVLSALIAHGFYSV